MNHLEYIDSFYKFKTPGGFKPGLERIQALLDRLGNPERKVKIIHVAGTNGKGSTSAMLASILRAGGYKVGLYTSPHLHSFHERIRVNGVPISDEELALITEKIKDIAEAVGEEPNLGGRPSFFEVVTAIAFLHFAEKEVDALVLEVGLGGRLDATNVAHPLASVITSIGFDHMEYLGNTLGQIAFEKAGIIKENTPVIIGVQNQEAFDSIANQAQIKNAPLYTPLQEANWEKVEDGLLQQTINLTLGEKDYPELEIGLVGEHQIRNSLLAIKTMELLQADFPKITDEIIRLGIKNVKWPGRLELVQDQPAVMLDGAHNIEGIEALSRFLEQVKGKFSQLHMVMSILGDKDVEPMVRKIAPLANTIVFTQNHNIRASAAERLANSVEGERTEIRVIPEFESAVRETIANAKRDDLVCITGSLYTISEARDILCPGDRGFI